MGAAKHDVDPLPLAAAFEQIPALLEKDTALIRRGTFFDSRFQVDVGEIPFDVEIGSGHVRSLQRGPFLMRPWQFAVRGTAEAWSRYWRPTPEPGWHDVFAIMKRGQMVCEGNLQPVMANLQYLKDLLALPRRLAAR